jgi:hypothetical protein
MTSGPVLIPTTVAKIDEVLDLIRCDECGSFHVLGACGVTSKVATNSAHDRAADEGYTPAGGS